MEHGLMQSIIEEAARLPGLSAVALESQVRLGNSRGFFYQGWVGNVWINNAFTRYFRG